MNTQRLRLVAERLEDLPSGKFDYDRWVGKDWAGKEDLSCGTTACALGWATTVPALRKAGLRLVAIFDSPSVGGYVGLRREPHCGSMHAAMRVFDIDFAQAEFLFSPDWPVNPTGHALGSSATAKDVAKLIRQFIRCRGNMAKVVELRRGKRAAARWVEEHA